MSKSRFATRPRLRTNARLRAKANAALDVFQTPGGRTRYFDGVPVGDMMDIVERVGFDIDPDERAMILCGREGRVSIPLRVGGVDVDHALVFTWYKMDATGRYEVVAYVS